MNDFKEKIKKGLEKFLNLKHSKAIFSVVVVILLLVPFLLFNNKGEKQISKKTFAHTAPGILKEEKLENVNIDNISMITNDEYTTFTADVTNIGTEPTEFENVTIILKDKAGKPVITLLGNVGIGLKPNETRMITASAKGTFENVSSKSIEPYVVK